MVSTLDCWIRKSFFDSFSKETDHVTHCYDSVLGLSIGISHALKNVNPFAWRSGAMDNLAYQNPLEWKQSAKERHNENEIILKKIEDRMSESPESKFIS